MTKPIPYVQNLFPAQLKEGTPRIALIGESPAKQEVFGGEPFLGPSGQILSQAMNSAGLTRSQCFIGNITGYRAPHDKLHTWGFFSPQVQEGIAQLKADLEAFQPDLIICLGGSPLSLFTSWSITKKSKVKGDRIVTFHPLDLEGPTKEVPNPKWTKADTAYNAHLDTRPAPPDVEGTTTKLQAAYDKKLLAWEKKSTKLLEKVTSTPPTLTKPTDLWATANRWDGSPSVTAMRGTFFRASHFLPGTLIFSTIHPAVVIREYSQYHLLKWDIAKAMKHWQGWEQPKREWKKLEFDDLCQALEDLEFFNGELGFDIEGYVSTGFPVLSIATSPSEAVCVPLIDRQGVHIWAPEQEEILWQKIERILSNPLNIIIMQNGSYELFCLGYRNGIFIPSIRDTMDVQWIILCEMPKGLGFLNSIYTLEPYYKDERVGTTFDDYCSYNVKDSCTTLEIHQKQMEIVLKDPDKIFQYNLYLELKPITVRMQIDGIRVDEDFLRTQALKALKNCHRYERAICNMVNRVAEQKGHVVMDSFNINSTHAQGDRQRALYHILGLKEYKKRGCFRTTADKDALYDIAKREHGSKYGKICRAMVRCAEASKRFSNFNMAVDPDGRVRSALQAPASETGRWASRVSNTGSGKNLQTEEKKGKWGYLADEDHYLFQYDLSGADSYTLAAYCASFGDTTMLDDLQAGLKPAKMIRYAIEHGPSSILGCSREELKRLSKLAPDDATYVGCKARWYGGSYGGGVDKTLMEIFKKSGGTVKLDRKTLLVIDEIILLRYPGIRQWQIFVEKQVQHKQRLKCASGHERLFLGDPRDSETVRTALSHEPQANTCYMANLALLRFYYGPLNADGLIKILLQVHDSLIGQFPRDSVELALPRIPTAFDNTIYIQGIPIRCPAEGCYGPSWGHANTLCYSDTWEVVKGEVDTSRPLNKI